MNATTEFAFHQHSRPPAMADDRNPLMRSPLRYGPRYRDGDVSVARFGGNGAIALPRKERHGHRPWPHRARPLPDRSDHATTWLDVAAPSFSLRKTLSFSLPHSAQRSACT